MTYEGVCHCGATAFVYHTALAPNDWPIRACQCSFCRAHAALSTSDPAGSLEFVERAPHALHRYQFGRKSADFLICRNCGVYLGALMRSDSGCFGIVNVRVLHSLLRQIREAAPMDYADEDPAARLGRRERRWTPARPIRD